MWKCSYGKEPFDLRLTVLRLIRSWKWIVLWTTIGVVLFAGGYCVKNVLLNREIQYFAESTYRADYSVADTEIGLVVINAATWDTYVHTEEFLNSVRHYLDPDIRINAQELGNAITGKLESDWRVPSTRVVTGNQTLSTKIAKAVEEAMTGDFAKGISELKSIRVIDPAGEAKPVEQDVRVMRAVILSVILSFFFSFLILLVKEISEDNIWLPATIYHRYGLKILGTPVSAELDQNWKYLFQGKTDIAVCPVQVNLDPADLTEKLQQRIHEQGTRLIALPSPLICSECVESMRTADGILLAVKAGRHAGKQLEYVMEYLEEQDCRITAAILCDADEILLKAYYGFGVPNQKKNRKDDVK